MAIIKLASVEVGATSAVLAVARAIASHTKTEVACRMISIISGVNFKTHEFLWAIE